MDMPLRMGYAEEARASRFEGLGTARREKLEGAGGETSAEWLVSQHAQDERAVYRWHAGPHARQC